MKNSHCLAPSRAHKIDAPISRTSYARLFPDLSSFSADKAFLFALGRSGGLCDCGDTDDDAASLGSEAAGWPFFGQYIAHDITADRSSLRSHVDTSQLRNARSPQLNLESLYSGGPAGSPYLFERDDSAKLLTSPDGRDVLRNYEGIAIIGDPRNDSHVFMSQMHLAFVRAHNAFVDLVRSEGTPESEVFDAAARELRWHYQTVVLREFLPRLVGPELVASLLAEGPRYYRPSGEPFIPLEFADAAYRYGHSQIRHRYILNDRSEPVRIFPELTGFQPVDLRYTIDWTRVFDSPGRPPAARAKKIDGRLVGALIALPAALAGDTEVPEFNSLAVRDLERGQGVGLPSGEAVARLLNEQPLSANEIGAEKAGWPGETPLWYYILREADIRSNGNRLGPVGARIVGDVLMGLLDLDLSSVRHAPAGWQPRSTLIELLTTGTPA